MNKWISNLFINLAGICVNISEYLVNEDLYKRYPKSTLEHQALKYCLLWWYPEYTYWEVLEFLKGEYLEFNLDSRVQFRSEFKDIPPQYIAKIIESRYQLLYSAVYESNDIPSS